MPDDGTKALAAELAAHRAEFAQAIGALKETLAALHIRMAELGPLLRRTEHLLDGNGEQPISVRMKATEVSLAHMRELHVKMEDDRKAMTRLVAAAVIAACLDIAFRVATAVL